MPYVLTQILSQLPLALFAGSVGMALFEPTVRTNGLALLGLCFLVAPGISFASLLVYRRINVSFGEPVSSNRSSFRTVVFGFGLSTLTLSILLLSLYFGGAVSFVWSKVNLLQLSVGAGLACISAPIEEVIFRGVLQRKLTGRLGPAAGVSVSALLFSLAHLSNPGAGVQSFLIVATFTGILLSATYWISRDLLACVAAHFTWNFLMFAIVGGNVSGFSSDGVVLMNADAGHLLSGGKFGIEASLLSPVAAALSFLLLYNLSGKRSADSQTVNDSSSQQGSAATDSTS